eukprot:15346023-Ditylum_brightwellii.AAC.1
MKKDYDATLPIEHLAEQIETAVMIMGNANQPYTAAQVLRIAYNPVIKTGVYKDACKEWRNKLEADKTGPNFKRHFVAAYADNLEENTATGMGYGANAVHQQQDLMEALEHLANAALSDQAALTNLTQANLMLVKQLKKAQQELETLKKKGGNNGNMSNQLTRGMHDSYYCWSHGITIKPNHTSQTCLRPKEGHKKEATITNMLGGKTKLNIPLLEAHRK